MQKKSILGIVSGIFALILWLVQRYFEVNDMITPQNSYLLLVGVAILGSICVGLLIWRFWLNVKQIFSNVRRLRLTLKPEQEYKNVGARSVRKVSEEERELLDFYERQRENWRSYLRLCITRVEPSVDVDVPKVVFSLKIINYLPVECKLVKVIHSSGTVNAGSFGNCALPALPESIEKRIPLCSEKSFPVEMEVKGTRFPDFIKPLLSNKGQRLQWILKGKWYIEIFGKTELWMTQEIIHDQLIEGFYTKVD